jgi:hypothetical protein
MGPSTQNTAAASDPDTEVLIRRGHIHQNSGLNQVTYASKFCYRGRKKRRSLDRLAMTTVKAGDEPEGRSGQAVETTRRKRQTKSVKVQKKLFRR